MKNGSQVSEREAPFQLRGNSFTMMVLKVVAPDDPSFFSQLTSKIRQAPNFFRNAPVVLDLEDLDPLPPGFDFVDFVVQLRSYNLIAVGVQGGSPELQALALEAGLPGMPAGRTVREQEPPRGEAERFGLTPGRAPTDPMPRRSPREAAPSGYPAPVEMQRTTLVVTEPVRSGRQVYAARGDLIVLGPVSPGAELLADGNIHVYGTLRGRALAGVSGDRNARIFCQSLEAELVSIAGLYRVSEDLDSTVFRKAVQVWLDDGYLRMDPIA